MAERGAQCDSESDDDDLLQANDMAAYAVLLSEVERPRRKTPRMWARDALKARESEGHYAKLLPKLRADREWCFK